MREGNRQWESLTVERRKVFLWTGCRESSWHRRQMKGDDAGREEDEWGWKQEVLMENHSSGTGEGREIMGKTDCTQHWDESTELHRGESHHSCFYFPLHFFCFCCPYPHFHLSASVYMSLAPLVFSSTALTWGLSPGSKFLPNHPKAEQRETAEADNIFWTLWLSSFNKIETDWKKGPVWLDYRNHLMWDNNVCASEMSLMVIIL